MDTRLAAQHRFINLVNTILLLAGMTTLMGALGWLLLGWEGVIWAVGACVFIAMFSPTVSPQAMLWFYRARPFGAHDLPQIQAAVHELARRAALEKAPQLYYIPSAMMNAFAVGGRENAAIAVTDGLLRGLSPRELVAVLAHEISHIRNNDTSVMGLADVISRLTSFFSFFGQILLLLNLPLVLMGEAVIPWLVVLILVAAPSLTAMMQMALSRTREFDADQDGARLSGDPTGLASALDKLERKHRGWRNILFPGRENPDPSMLRSHPQTKERIKRLLALSRSEPALHTVFKQQRPAMPGFGGLVQRPRRRITGVWF